MRVNMIGIDTKMTFMVRQDHQHEADAVFVRADSVREAAEAWLRRRHGEDPAIEDATVYVWSNGRGMMSSTRWHVTVEAVPVYRARPAKEKP